MCSCSARFTCRWCIITRCFVGGYPILLSDGITWNDCKCFVLQASALQQCNLPSPAPSSSGPAGNPRPGDGEAGSPKKAQWIQGRKRETRVLEESVCEQSKLMVVQDDRGLAGALVYNCRTPFYQFQSHCGTYVVRRQIGRLHLLVWLPPPWKTPGQMWRTSWNTSPHYRR